MKKIIYGALIALTVVACKKERADFVTFSGKIENKNSDKLTIFSPQTGYKKEISVAEDGSFKDTLKVVDGFFLLSDGRERTTVFFQNGDNISMKIDTKQFDETVTYSGDGAEESNILAELALEQERFMSDNEIYKLSKANFDAKIEDFTSNILDKLSNKSLDTSFVSMQKKGVENLKNYLDNSFADKQYMMNTLGKGMPSPKFLDYENYKGGKTSLDDLKGKYVYIDMWATWCQPCKAEIPFLQKVEKQYHGKKIEFVSISIDQSKDRETWKKMVADKNLTGIQLYANRDPKFQSAYRVNSIPRFILIDPQGNIVDANAPRPSSPKLIELFNSLNI